MSNLLKNLFGHAARTPTCRPQADRSAPIKVEELEHRELPGGWFKVSSWGWSTSNAVKPVVQTAQVYQSTVPQRAAGRIKDWATGSLVDYVIGRWAQGHDYTLVQKPIWVEPIPYVNALWNAITAGRSAWSI